MTLHTLASHLGARLFLTANCDQVIHLVLSSKLTYLTISNSDTYRSLQPTCIFIRSSRSALWTSSGMIRKAALSWLICNVAEHCRLWRTFWTIWKSKIDFAKVNTSSCSNLFSLFLTMITVRWRLYQARAWIRYHPSSWDWCTLPLRYLWTGFYRSELVCWRSSSIMFFLNWFFSLRSFQENQICLWVNIFRISLRSHSTFARVIYDQTSSPKLDKAKSGNKRMS